VSPETQTPPRSREEQLEWEDGRRVPAATCAALAAALTLAGALVAALVGRRDSPDLTSELLNLYDRRGTLVISVALLAVGALALAFPLNYLYEATRFRRPEAPRVAQVTLLFGVFAVAVAQVVSQLMLISKAGDFATHGGQTYEEAKDLLEGGALRAAQGAALAGQLSLGFGLVMISLNAMRVGLLTRFMGVLGIIVGVLFVIPLGTLPIVQSFWLGALAALLLGRWPNGVPPAWRSGKAEPWPSQQELREERERGKAPSPEPAPAAAPAGRAHPVSKKRRRKKRR
jgi:MFS family permease